MTSSLLLTDAYIHSVAEPYATALHADQGVVSWLGDTDTAQRMVAATASGPVTTQSVPGRLITTAFIDGFSCAAPTAKDPRTLFSTNEPDQQGSAVHYAKLDAAQIDTADGIFVFDSQLGELNALLSDLKPPTQLLIQSSGAQDVESILALLEQQPNATLRRSRHRILLNHELTKDQITRLVAVHASVTVVPEVLDTGLQFRAPVASLITQGVHVATGSGSWGGTIWDLLTALIEHPDTTQRVSTRAAFNTVSRDGIRVLPSRIAQTHMSAGQINVGAPADLNVWTVDQLGVQAPDVTAAHWSTDERAGTALLPILSSQEAAPQLELMIRAGQLV